ncbi:spore germination protein [Paenibacillus monticola]|uniref:Spore germination protein n=1 Tax=Paenibacillus monticola TaxID=2666075 RepID=A0A7X2H893_9BACL|nr:spore germination protein [Paenibacillus monticola]
MHWMKTILKPAKRRPLKNTNPITQTPEPINSSLPHTLTLLHKILGDSPDFIMRNFSDSPSEPGPIAICYIEGLIEQNLLSDLMEALIAEQASKTSFTSDVHSTINALKQKIPTGNIKIIHAENQMIAAILAGNVVILVDGVQVALAASIQGGIRRAVEEPTTQTVIRGPKEGFTEELSTNITLLRRKLRTPDLKFASRNIGRYTQTRVVLAYIEGLAQPEVIEEAKKRLESIDTDSILESGYIEEFIQDAPLSPFPTLLNTERPDTVAGSLLDGQIAIFIDGTPFVLLAPVTFIKFFHSSEDYYQRYDISSFLRIIRLFSFLIALLLPSLYIAITTFHQEMLPTTLLITLASQREGTPFPALLEALIMELIFEVIREAGVRMPRVIGPAISIVGALVIGQAAVQAGLVSAAMVIVVSFTAISNFVIPSFNMASTVRLIRFFLMLMAGMLGLFGILAGLIPILFHLVALQSFGVRYLTPFAPFTKSNMKDFFIRVPWWAMKTRPNGISGPNKTRQAPHQYPVNSAKKERCDEPNKQK